MNVAVIGASDKPDRYSYKAIQMLKDKGHVPLPVHQRLKTIAGLSVYPRVEDIKEPVDTITLYVSADISSALAPSLLAKNPKRIIFNPGAENPQLEDQARAKGIKTLNACTLVMLTTGQF